MSLDPAMSIICPCYNHGRYIEGMLESVFAQTFSDYQVIIVNDGSTDNTKEILDGFHHKKLHILHTHNRGPAAARNTAIAAARGSIILNLDADDKIAPSLLAQGVKVFNDYPDVGIVTSEVCFFGDRRGRFILPTYSLRDMLKDNIIHSTAFFRKVDWEKAGGYSNDLIYGLEDYDFWLSIIELGRDVYRIPEELIFYRTYKNPDDCRSGRRKKSRRRLMHSMLTIFHRHENIFKSHPEEYWRMRRLEHIWKNEPLTIQWLKQAYISGRRFIESRFKVCNDERS
jgi:glycosyltransferase involved in cell wall biosynthesis